MKRILVEACYMNDKQMFKQKDLRVKLNAKTPVLTVEKIFTTGEISKLYAEYKKLAGFSKASVKEIKK